MKNNFVSVIMPVFNAGKYVEEAIESVLNQTYKNFEFICVNDHSTDNSLSILESFGDKIKVINNKNNCGTAESRNNGIRIANGEFLAFIDNDDVWEKNKLEIQINQFKNNPDLDISFSNMECFLSPELNEAERKLYYCPTNPIPGYIPSSIVIKRTSFDKVGYFDSKWKNGESVAWLSKIQEIGLKEETTNRILLKRRIHKSNKSIVDKSISNQDYLSIIKEHFDWKMNNKSSKNK